MNQEENQEQAELFLLYFKERGCDAETVQIYSKRAHMKDYREDVGGLPFNTFVLGYQAALSSKQEIKAQLCTNMIKFLGATKLQAKAIVNGVFDGESNINKDDLVPEHIEINQELAQRLIDACEGELEGVVVDTETSKRILDYVLNKLV